jgi:hypothetical protein
VSGFPFSSPATKDVIAQGGAGSRAAARQRIIAGDFSSIFFAVRDDEQTLGLFAGARRSNV